MARRKKSSKRGCSVGTISFRTKRGKRIEFRGRSGTSCGPRKKPSTRHLAVFKKAFKAAAKKCHQSSRKARNACVRAKLK